MKYCQNCGTKLNVKGLKPWQTFLECKNGHKYEVFHGDPIGGSSDQIFKIEKFPHDMKLKESNNTYDN